MHVYASLCVAALLGSSVGTWLRKFMLREVRTFVCQFSCQLLHSLLLPAGYPLRLVLAYLGELRHAFARVRLQQRVPDACLASPVRAAVARFGWQRPCLLFLPNLGDVCVELLFLALQGYRQGQQPSRERAAAADGNTVAWRNVFFRGRHKPAAARDGRTQFICSIQIKYSDDD